MTDWLVVIYALTVRPFVRIQRFERRQVGKRPLAVVRALPVRRFK